MNKQIYESANEKLIWLRTMAALALPHIHDPVARARLESALAETAPARTEAEQVRQLELDCMFARPQAMGVSHKEEPLGS